jgi:hypothetical protein
MDFIFNRDNSFFSIESPDLIASPGIEQSVTKLITDDLISFSVTEELGKITQGQLSILDNNQVYSRIFRNGMSFKITWGYKKFNDPVNLASLGKRDPNELLGNSERRGLNCIVQSPGGGGNNQGNTQYDVTFYGSEYIGTKVRKIFRSGTRKQVVSDVFRALGVNSPIIDFPSQSDQLTNGTSIMQWETDYALLLRLANEWKAMFLISFNPRGQKTGIFVDPQKISDQKVQSFIRDNNGSNRGYLRTLYYNDGERSNVKSYKWKHNVGVSGQGDRVELKLINGRVVTQRYVAKTQNVSAYRLNMNKINKAYQNKNLTDRTALVKNALNVENFDEAEWAFDAVESETAPQGMGLEISAEMVGDPMLTLPMEARCVGNFPAILQQSRGQLGDLTKLFFRKITHNFTKGNGYQVSTDIADAYTITGSAIAPVGNV